MRITLFFFVITVCIFKGNFIPILDIELARFRSFNGDVFIVRYRDIPANVNEEITLDCLLPKAETYEWQLSAKSGSPYAGSVQLGLPINRDIFRPWSITLTEEEYMWDAMLVKCTAKVSNRNMITLVWVIAKLKSNTESPYHPAICSFKKAKCLSKMYNCINGNGSTYRGTQNRSKSESNCLFWNSLYPYKSEFYFDPYDNILKDVDAVFEANGNHNYCRNVRNALSEPFCVNQNSKIEVCNIPQCTDCMYGIGDGFYPDKVSAPLYFGTTTRTVIETINDSGERSLQKCYRGQSVWWAKNVCKTNPDINGRKEIGSKPICLIVDPQYRPPFPENPGWSGYIWARCVAQQCTIRQVWFALVDMDGFVHLDENNKDYIQIPILIGKKSNIYFYHFGTTFCSSFSLRGEDATEPFADFIPIFCKNTPEISYLQIANPIKEYCGKYTLQYYFTEGNPLLDVVDYRLNFELVSRIPTSIVIQPILFCPGYSTTVEAEILGSYSLNPNSIKWLFTNDNITWYDVNAQKENFALSMDGLMLEISKITKEIFIKVKASSLSGETESVQKVTFLDIPYISQSKSTFEENAGTNVNFQIKHKSSANVKWMFGYTLIQGNKIYTLSTIRVDSQYATSSLKIANLDKNNEGIYTAEVTDKKCSSSVSFYLSVKG